MTVPIVISYLVCAFLLNGYVQFAYINWLGYFANPYRKISKLYGSRHLAMTISLLGFNPSGAKALLRPIGCLVECLAVMSLYSWTDQKLLLALIPFGICISFISTTLASSKNRERRLELWANALAAEHAARTFGKVIEKLDAFAAELIRGLTEMGDDMPSKSKEQENFFNIAAHNPEFAKQHGISPELAKEWREADKASHKPEEHQQQPQDNKPS